VSSYSQSVTRPLIPSLVALATLLLCCRALAGPAEEPFYRQLIDLRSPSGYQPTRAFTIVVDASQGNRLVAEDDPALQFNLLWLDQFQPGYRQREGGAGLGLVFRSYLRHLFEAWRGQNGGSFNYLPDGDIDAPRFGGVEGEMEYHLRVSDDEVKVRFEYIY
jgi:hypothetical protein